MSHSTKSKKRPPRKTGRPSVYDAATHPITARIETGKGKTLADLAKTIGVARSTVEEWIKLHPEFSAGIDQGREDQDDRIERALFERAVGYKHPETKLMTVSLPSGMSGPGGSVVERHEVTTHYPPDPTCLKFWLTNRRRKFWSDKQKIEHGGTLTLEQLLAQSWKDPTAEPEKKPEST